MHHLPILAVLFVACLPIHAQTQAVSTFKEVCATVQSIAIPDVASIPIASGADASVTIGVRVSKDGTIAAILLDGPRAIGAAAVKAATAWRFAELPKPEYYPFRFRIIFRWPPNGSHVGLGHQDDDLVVEVPRGQRAGDRVEATEEVLKWMATAKPFHPYPREARERGIQGDVEVQMDIDATGKVVGARGVSGPPLLTHGSEEAARGWRFRPLKIDDAPALLSGRMTFRWRQKTSM